MTTLSDVARLAGVSLATASRALSGARGRTVRPELRDRVLAAARELDYVPHAAAQTMARGLSTSLCLLVNDIADPYFASIASGVTAAASRHGSIVTLSSTGIDARARAEVVNLMAAQRVRGLIVAGSVRPTDPGLDELRAALRRLVATGARVATIGAEQLGYSSVLLPNQAGSVALAEALLELGYRSFAILAGPDDRPSARQRATAFADRVLASGGVVTAQVECSFERTGGYQAMTEVLDGRAPQAVFAVNELLALGALRRIRELGLSVPDDIGLASFGDGTALADVVPEITAVYMDSTHAGELAVELTLGPDDQVRHVPLEFGVRLRKSTRR